MTQTPLYVPAPAGWYLRPGDPPQHVRHWDGQSWLCDVKGPARDHFEYLRSMPPEVRSPEDQQLLRRLTAEVSAIEDLVLADPRSNPPLVMAPQPTAPDPYAGQQGYAPYGAAGSYAPTFAPARSAGSPRRATSGGGAGGLGKGIIKVVGGLALIIVVVVVRLVFWDAVNDTKATTILAVDKCITLAHKASGKTTGDVTYASADCVTKSGSKVSYKILSKLTGNAACGPDEGAVTSFDSSSKAIDFTYCLMPNLVKGQCLYVDDKDFEFDISCADPKAAAKVMLVADKGAGVACAAGEVALAYPKANRSYCLGAP